jgi:hypothetical protein
VLVFIIVPSVLHVCMNLYWLKPVAMGSTAALIEEKIKQTSAIGATYAGSHR